MHQIITIERQFGSGGRQIGKMVAEQLNKKFYNDNLLHMAAEKLGISANSVEQFEEVTDSFFRNLAMLTDYAGEGSPGVKLFYAEREIIQKVAAFEECVIVGHCANNILADKKNCLKVFIYADEKFRQERAVREYGIAESQVSSVLHKADKRRDAFYNFRSETRWQDMAAYDVCLNSGVLGIETCVGVITHLAIQ